MKIFFSILISSLLSMPLQAETFRFIGTYFPQLLEQTGGQVQGFGADIAREIVNRSGHQIEIKLYPWKRALVLVKNGNADALIGTYKTHTREVFLDYTQEPFYQDQVVFYKRMDSDITWDGDLDSVKQRKIGTVLGWSYGPHFDRNKKHLNITEGHSTEAMLSMLDKGRIDLLAINSRNALSMINKLGLEKSVRPIDPPIDHLNVYFGFSKAKNLSTLRHLFDRELKQMAEDRRLEGFEKRYNLNSLQNDATHSLSSRL